MADNKPRKKSYVTPFPMVLIPVLLGFAALFFYFAYDAYATIWMHLDAKNRYHQIEGVVQSCEIVENQNDEGPDYDAYIAYAYAVDGKEYTSQRRTFGGIRVSLTQEDVQTIAARYPPNGQVMVYYDPADPAQAVLEIEPSFTRWGIAVAMVPFTFFGFLLIYIAAKRVIMHVRKVPGDIKNSG